jgi:hypothetical protein
MTNKSRAFSDPVVMSYEGMSVGGYHPHPDASATVRDSVRLRERKITYRKISGRVGLFFPVHRATGTDNNEKQ